MKDRVSLHELPLSPVVIPNLEDNYIKIIVVLSDEIGAPKQLQARWMF